MMRLNHIAMICAAGLLVTAVATAETDAKGASKEPAGKAAPAATQSTIHLQVTGMT